MLVLGVETTTEYCGLALHRDDKVVGEVELDLGRQHCEKILVVLDGLLSALGVQVADLDAIAVSQGPGSFTGLRIGLAFAEGLALASGCRLVGVPTLDAIAHGAGLWEGSLLACIDARRGEVYFGAYARGKGKTRPIGPSRVGAVDEAAKLCASLAPPLSVVGNAASRIQIAVGPGARLGPPEYGLPRAAVVAALGAEKLHLGSGDVPERVEPIYLRRSDAEIRRDVLAGRT